MLCTGGLYVILKEAWLVCKTRSGDRLCWELEELKRPKKGGCRPRNPTCDGSVPTDAFLRARSRREGHTRLGRTGFAERSRGPSTLRWCGCKVDSGLESAQLGDKNESEPSCVLTETVHRGARGPSVVGPRSHGAQGTPCVFGGATRTWTFLTH